MFDAGTESVYACPMADNSNPSYMVDLEFCRWNTITDRNEYMGTTVYSVEDDRETRDNMAAAGWKCYMSQRVI